MLHIISMGFLHKRSSGNIKFTSSKLWLTEWGLAPLCFALESIVFSLMMLMEKKQWCDEELTYGTTSLVFMMDFLS
jgi:hypothetical protein